MSFKTYAIHVQPDGTLGLDDPHPLRFSGPKGLIAKFVLTCWQRGEERWQLSSAELHALASPEWKNRQRLIVFEQSEETKLERLAVESVQGISTQQTDMMFTFRPLQAVARVGDVATWRARSDKTYTEGLMLEGGVSGPTGSWRWGRPHMALGGVVCGGTARNINR